MIARRTPKTGKPAVLKDRDGEYTDKASKQKIDKVNSPEKTLFKNIVPDGWGEFLQLEKDIEKIVSDDNSWIAVIHADGNDFR